MAPGPPTAGSGPSKIFFPSPLQGRTDKGTSTETKQRAPCVKWLLTSSPVNTMIATKLRMVLPKKIQTNAKQSGPGFPSEPPGAGNFDETTWYGFLSSWFRAS